MAFLKGPRVRQFAPPTADHPDYYEKKAFDEGWITDGRGKKVYFSDAIVIMTSNLGAEEIGKLTRLV